jgi:hypothetical protein
MNQQILRATAVCAGLSALVAGCGSSLISQVDREDSGTGFAEQVVKLSDSQDITEVKETATGAKGHATLWTDSSLGFREWLGLNDQPELIELARDLYVSSFKRIGERGIGPRGCYDQSRLSLLPKISADVLPLTAKVYRVSHQTAFFRSSPQVYSPATFIGSSKTTGRSAIDLAPEHGYFRFNARGLATYEVITTNGMAGTTSLVYSYPKALTAKLMTKPPANICNPGQN